MENFTEDDRYAIEDSIEKIKNAGLLNGKYDYIKFETFDLFSICKLAQDALLKDQILLEINPPITIVGDIHANFNGLQQIFQKCGDPEHHKYLFLGDYIDRGPNSIEVMTTLLCYKLLYPNNIYLIRGNHESKEVCVEYGFFQECVDRYNENIFNEFIAVFNNLPMAAIVGKSIFCVHGGISQEMGDVNKLRSVERPLIIPSSGFLLDLLWSDPSVVYPDFHVCEMRGGSFTYGKDAAERFLKENNLKHIVRSHQMTMEGYDYAYGHDNDMCISVFSTANYCEEFDNKGAVMHVDSDMNLSFTIFEK